jgi:Family of unknown function (DUF6541)
MLIAPASSPVVRSHAVADPIRVVVAIALVLVLPGVLVLLAARVRLTIVEWLATVPACSLGLVFVVAEFVTLVGAPFGPAAFFVLLAVLAIAAALRMRTGWCRPLLDRNEGKEGRARKWHHRGVLVALGLLVVAIVVGSATWLLPMRDKALIAPGYDAMIHGFMIARVTDTESVSSRDVLVMDARGRDRAAADYYPLALHASVSIAHRVTDAPIGNLLNGVIVLFAALVFPLSLFALTRHLLPEEPLAAGFSAVIGALITMFPYQPVSWGLIPLMVGMTLVPITIVLLIRTVLNEWSRARAAVTGLVIVSDFTLHNSQLPLILGLAALCLLFRDRRLPRPPWRDVFTRLLWIGLVAAALAAPTLKQMLAGVGERVDASTRTGTVNAGDFLGQLLTLNVVVTKRQSWLMVLAAAGIVVLLWRRQLTGWVAGAAVIGGLAVLAATADNAVANTLTLPWYQEDFRVSYNAALFVPVFGAVLLGVGTRLVAQQVSRSAFSLAATAIIVLASLYPIGAAQALRSNRDMVSTAYAREAPVRKEHVAAFNFLGRHTRPPESVLSDTYIDGATWMYPLAGVNPLFGMGGEGKQWTDRLYLRDHLQELGQNKRLDDIIRRLRVRFVYFGEKTMRMAGQHVLTLSLLRSLPRLEEVFNKQGAHVFEVHQS